MKILKKIEADVREWFSIFSAIETVLIIVMTSFTLFVLVGTVFLVIQKELL